MSILTERAIWLGIVIGMIAHVVRAEVLRRRDIAQMKQRFDRLIAAVPGLKIPATIEPGDEWTYGTWRGKRARRNERTGYRYYEDAWSASSATPGEKFWSQLGVGYEDEFTPDQVKRSIFGLLKP